MKKALIALAVSSLGLATGVASADNKHLYVNVNAAPVYRTPAPYYHGYQHRPYYTNYGHRGYNGHHRGYWHNGRWIAPVVVGAAVGALAIAATAPVYAAPVYHAPVYAEPVSYYNAPVDRFSAADLNGDGYLSFYEARRHGNLHRNFGAIDWNGDGYLSRDEINAWRYHW
jgi:EF hand